MRISTETPQHPSQHDTPPAAHLNQQHCGSAAVPEPKPRAPGWPGGCFNSLGDLPASRGPGAASLAMAQLADPVVASIRRVTLPASRGSRPASLAMAQRAVLFAGGGLRCMQSRDGCQLELRITSGRRSRRPENPRLAPIGAPTRRLRRCLSLAWRLTHSRQEPGVPSPRARETRELSRARACVGSRAVRGSRPQLLPG